MRTGAPLFAGAGGVPGITVTNDSAGTGYGVIRVSLLAGAEDAVAALEARGFRRVPFSVPNGASGPIPAGAHLQ
jgi:hypothetical protein